MQSTRDYIHTPMNHLIQETMFSIGNLNLTQILQGCQHVQCFNNMQNDADGGDSEALHQLSPDDAAAALELDWKRDSRGDGDVDEGDFRRSIVELAATWCMPMYSMDPSGEYLAFLEELRPHVFPDYPGAARQHEEFVLANKEIWRRDLVFLGWAFKHLQSQFKRSSTSLSSVPNYPVHPPILKEPRGATEEACSEPRRRFLGEGVR